MSLRVVFGPWSQLSWAPSAWWRDLPPAFKICWVSTRDRSRGIFRSLLEPRLDAAPGSRIHQLQAAAFVPFTGAELRQAQRVLGQHCLTQARLGSCQQESVRARTCVRVFTSYVVGSDMHTKTHACMNGCMVYVSCTCEDGPRVSAWLAGSSCLELHFATSKSNRWTPPNLQAQATQ